MKKVYSVLGISLLALSLAACDNVDAALGIYSAETVSSEESSSSSTSYESASLNAVDSDSSSASDASSNSESDGVVASSEETGLTEEIDTSSSVAAEQEVYSQSSEAVPSSEVEAQDSNVTNGQPTANQGAFDNNRARELLSEAAPLISADSQGAYQSDEYFFLPTLVNENLAQVDVFRQSPDGQGHSNLIATYRYDAYTGTLTVMDVVSGTWQNTGQ